MASLVVEGVSWGNVRMSRLYDIWGTLESARGGEEVRTVK